MYRKIFLTNALSNGSTLNTDKAKPASFPYMWMESSKPQNFYLTQLLSFIVYHTWWVTSYIIEGLPGNCFNLIGSEIVVSRLR